MIKENKVQSGYKKSPIGLIPNDWKISELSEISKIKRGRFSPRPRDDPRYYNGSIPFVQTSDVTNSDSFISTYTQTLNDEGLKVSILFPKGTILMTIAANIGHTAILEIDMACPDSLVGISCNEKIINRFLNYMFKYIQKRIEYIAPGAQKNINVEFLEPLAIVVPPLIEQTAIANLLSTWDKAIQTTNSLIEQKQNRKKWLMQMLLTGKKRLKGFSGKSEFHVLGNYIKEVSERNKENKVQNVLSVTNRRGFINQSEQFDRVVASEDSTNYKIVRKGQFAYNPSRVNVGSLDLLKDFNEGILSPMYVVFETNSKKLDPIFLFYHLKSNWFNGHIPMFVQGSVRDSLSFDGLCGMKFFIPSMQEQTEIAKIIEVSDKEIQLLQNKLDQLKEQKKGLMQILLTGKKRLKVN